MEVVFGDRSRSSTRPILITNSSYKGHHNTSDMLVEGYSPAINSLTSPTGMDWVDVTACPGFSIDLVGSTEKSWRLAERVEAGLVGGVNPSLAEGSTGGVYYMRDVNRNIVGVFKPMDEEPYAPNNPHDYIGFALGDVGIKSGIMVGEGAVREHIAFLLDVNGGGFYGVPHTMMAWAKDWSDGCHSKRGSFQEYVRHLCSAEDMGSARFATEDVHSMAILDIRLANQDRHPGNVLVCDEPASSDLTSTLNEDENDYDFENPIHSAGAEPRKMSRSWAPGTAATHTLARRRPGKHPKLCIPADPAAVSVGEQAGQDVSAKKTKKCLRLVPIDHGMCLPAHRAMHDTCFAWHFWPQSNEPLSAPALAHIAGLDSKRDEEVLRERLGGECPPNDALLTLHICTALLQRGAAAGLTLRSIAGLMVRDVGSAVEQPSALEVAVRRAHGCDSPAAAAAAAAAATAPLPTSCAPPPAAAAAAVAPSSTLGGGGGVAGVGVAGGGGVRDVAREGRERDELMVRLVPLLDQLVADALAQQEAEAACAACRPPSAVSRSLSLPA